MDDVRKEKQDSNKSNRLVKNTFLLFISNFASKILSFLMVPFYTSILTTSDYGTADLISTTVLLVLPIFSMLMDEAAMRFVLDKEIDKKQVFTVSLALSTVGFLVVLCISPLILLIDSLRPYYSFTILYYVSLWLYNLFSNFVKGLDKFGIITIAGIIHTILYIGVNIFTLVILKLGIYGYLLATSISNLITAIFIFVVCGLYKYLINIKKLNFKLGKQMVKYSLPMIPDYISWWINNASDRYVLGYFCDSSTIGIYSVAGKIPTILNSLSSIFSSAWKISSADDFGSEDSKRFFAKIFDVYSTFLMIGSSLLIVMTKFLAKILFANDFYVAWEITPILLIANVVSAQAIFVGSIFTASKKTKTLFYSSMGGAIINTICNFYLIPQLEGIGAAIATVCGYFTILIANIILTRRIIKIDFAFRKNIISYLILFFQSVVLINLDCTYGVLIVAILFVAISILWKNELLSLIKIAINKFNRRGAFKI